MEFHIIPTRFLIEQIEEFDDKTKRIIKDKKELIKINPSRYKKVETEKYNHVFSVKLSSKGESKRLIYAVIGNIIFLCFVLDRSKGYKDIERYFKKVENELR